MSHAKDFADDAVAVGDGDDCGGVESDDDHDGDDDDGEGDDDDDDDDDIFDAPPAGKTNKSLRQTRRKKR